MKLLYGDRFIVDLTDTVTYITVDPSGGTSPAEATRRTDKWGFSVVAVTSDAKWFVLDMFAQHLNEAMFMDLLWTLDAKWHPYRIGIEKAPHLDAYMRLEFARKNKTLNLVKLEPKGRKKERRIQALSSQLPNIYFSSKIAGEIQHLFRRWYTEQEHGDDMLDALAYQIDIAVPPTAQMLNEQREYRLKASEREALERLPASQRPEWEAWLKYERDSKHGQSVSDEFMDMYDYE